jgi:molecular chaperone DnaK (HSP70)
MDRDLIVGIDLGTTNSEVAVWLDDGIKVLEENGTALFPSVVGLDPDGKLLVGERARNQYALYPTRTVKSVKRQMGLAENVTLADRTFSPQELSAMILCALKERAEKALGAPVRKAVITVPAYFSEAQRQATRDAGRIAGLEVVRLIHEPTAAVLAYENKENITDEERTTAQLQTVLVYDLGGGTLDVSVVRALGEVTEVLSGHGDTHLGGDDFDQLLYEHIMVHLRENLGVGRSSDDLSLKNRLLRAAEEAKKRLSFEERAMIREEFVGTRNGVPVHLELEVTRERFEVLVRPLLERSLRSVHQALEGAGKQPADIDRVLLVGGSTRIPLVSVLLEQTLGKKPSKDIDPELCVAHGAGVLAARTMGREIEKVLVDVSPYAFGTSAVGVINNELCMDKFAEIIPRNTPLPCSRSDDFSTIFDNQNAVEVKIFQGEHEDARRNLLVGEFLIEGLSKVPAGNVIRLRMDLDVNGLLHVTACEQSTGLEKSVTIKDALRAMTEDELAAARRTLAETAGDAFGRTLDDLHVNEDDDESSAGEDFAEDEGEDEDADLKTAEAWSGGKEFQARALLDKARRLLEKMNDEDRAEALRLIAFVEEAGKLQNVEQLTAGMDELAEMLFFVEENE